MAKTNRRVMRPIEDPWGFNPKQKRVSIFTPMPTKNFSRNRTIIQPVNSLINFGPKRIEKGYGDKIGKNMNFMGINVKKNIPKKEMNWIQAKSKYPHLNPYGDADKDRLMNMFDCKPFNKKRQDEFSSEAKEKIEALLKKTDNPALQNIVWNAKIKRGGKFISQYDIPAITKKTPVGEQISIFKKAIFKAKGVALGVVPYALSTGEKVTEKEQIEKLKANDEAVEQLTMNLLPIKTYAKVKKKEEPRAREKKWTEMDEEDKTRYLENLRLKIAAGQDLDAPLQVLNAITKEMKKEAGIEDKKYEKPQEALIDYITKAEEEEINAGLKEDGLENDYGERFRRQQDRIKWKQAQQKVKWVDKELLKEGGYEPWKDAKARERVRIKEERQELTPEQKDAILRKTHKSTREKRLLAAIRKAEAPRTSKKKETKMKITDKAGSRTKKVGTTFIATKTPGRFNVMGEEEGPMRFTDSELQKKSLQDLAGIIKSTDLKSIKKTLNETVKIEQNPEKKTYNFTITGQRYGGFKTKEDAEKARKRYINKGAGDIKKYIIFEMERKGEKIPGTAPKQKTPGQAFIVSDKKIKPIESIEIGGGQQTLAPVIIPPEKKGGYFYVQAGVQRQRANNRTEAEKIKKQIQNKQRRTARNIARRNTREAEEKGIKKIEPKTPSYQIIKQPLKKEEKGTQWLEPKPFTFEKKETIRPALTEEGKKDSYMMFSKEDITEEIKKTSKKTVKEAFEKQEKLKKERESIYLTKTNEPLMKGLKNYIKYKIALGLKVGTPIDEVNRVAEPIINKLNPDIGVMQNRKVIDESIPSIIRTLPQRARFDPEIIEKMDNPQALKKLRRDIIEQQNYVKRFATRISEGVAQKPLLPLKADLRGDSQEILSEYNLLLTDIKDREKQIVKPSVKPAPVITSVLSPQAMEYLDLESRDSWGILGKKRLVAIDEKLFQQKSPMIKSQTIAPIKMAPMKIQQIEKIEPVKIQPKVVEEKGEPRSIWRYNVMDITQPYVGRKPAKEAYPSTIKIPTKGLTAKQVEAKIKIKTKEPEKVLTFDKKGIIERTGDILGYPKIVKAIKGKKEEFLKSNTGKWLGLEPKPERETELQRYERGVYPIEYTEGVIPISSAEYTESEGGITDIDLFAAPETVTPETVTPEIEIEEEESPREIIDVEIKSFPSESESESESETIENEKEAS